MIESVGRQSPWMRCYLETQDGQAAAVHDWHTTRFLRYNDTMRTVSGCACVPLPSYRGKVFPRNMIRRALWSSAEQGITHGWQSIRLVAANFSSYQDVSIIRGRVERLGGWGVTCMAASAKMMLLPIVRAPSSADSVWYRTCCTPGTESEHRRLGGSPDMLCSCRCDAAAVRAPSSTVCLWYLLKSRHRQVGGPASSHYTGGTGIFGLAGGPITLKVKYGPGWYILPQPQITSYRTSDGSAGLDTSAERHLDISVGQCVSTVTVHHQRRTASPM
jgi:hypothetical protein